MHKNYIVSMARINDSTELDEILKDADLGDIDDISYAPMEKQHDGSEELLGVTTGPVKNTGNTSEMALCDGGCEELRAGLDSCQGSYSSSSNIRLQSLSLLHPKLASQSGVSLKAIFSKVLATQV